MMSAPRSKMAYVEDEWNAYAHARGISVETFPQYVAAVAHGIVESAPNWDGGAEIVCAALAFND